MTDSTPRIIVTQKGPIDRHEPGADVTGLYRPETVTRLVKDGYLRRSYLATADNELLTADAEAPASSQQLAVSSLATKEQPHDRT